MLACLSRCAVSGARSSCKYALILGTCWKLGWDVSSLQFLVGTCRATGDRIFATGSNSVSKLFCDPVAVFA